MKRTSLLLFLAALVLIPALLLTGCSKKKTTTNAGSTPAATQAPSGAAAQASPTRAAAASTAAPTSAAGIVATIASGAGATAIEACRMITKEEAGTALGEAAKDPEGINIGSQTVAPGITVSVSSCTYDSNSGARSVEVTFWRAAGTGTAQLRQAFEQFLCAQKERVSGLGDVACWYDSTHTELQILKGGTFVDLQISQASGPDRSEALKTLAQRALARLQ
jgi:hypothetical protein